MGEKAVERSASRVESFFQKFSLFAALQNAFDIIKTHDILKNERSSYQIDGERAGLDAIFYSEKTGPSAWS